MPYVLITPARNEADFIQGTIDSLKSQTVLPLKWVIVSDGSTDGTDEIVKAAQARCSWIELVQMPQRKERHFGGKVAAFNAGYSRVKDLDYEVIGSMDADISFESGLFQYILEKMAGNPRLGVAGVPFREEGKTYDFRFSSVNHVSGACQLFRRACFEEIGGYVPVKGGGIDVIAVLTAKMKGWQVRTFPEKSYNHHRPMGSAKHSEIVIRFKDGVKDYYLGSHPAWELFRGVYQMSRKPAILGGGALLCGFFLVLDSSGSKADLDRVNAVPQEGANAPLKDILGPWWVAARLRGKLTSKGC